MNMCVQTQGLCWGVSRGSIAESAFTHVSLYICVYVTVHAKRVIFALCKHLSTEVIKNFRALSSNLRLILFKIHFSNLSWCDRHELDRFVQKISNFQNTYYRKYAIFVVIRSYECH